MLLIALMFVGISFVLLACASGSRKLLLFCIAAFCLILVSSVEIISPVFLTNLNFGGSFKVTFPKDFLSCVCDL